MSVMENPALDFLKPVKTFLVMRAAGPFLGLDPSEANFGVAVLEDNVLYAGTFQPNEEPYPGRLHHIECAVRGIATIVKPQLACIEGYAFGAAFGVARSGATGGVARLGLIRAGFPFHEIPPTTVKQFATGKGSGKKEMMMLATGAAGIEIKDNDEADACWLCLLSAAIGGIYGSEAQRAIALKAIQPKPKKEKKRGS